MENIENTIIKNAKVEYSIKISIPLTKPVVFLVPDDPEEQNNILNQIKDLYPENKEYITNIQDILLQAYKLKAVHVELSSLNLADIEIRITFKTLDSYEQFCSYFNL